MNQLNLEKFKNLTVITLIIAAALSISLPGAFSSGPVHPDGQRYTFNGILLHDMIRDGGIFRPYEYAINFYARYPATNLPYGPPFFALIFALAFCLFGISFSVAKCLVAFYTVISSLMLFFLVNRIMKNLFLSVLAVAVFLSNPLTGICSRDIGPETAIAFHSLLALYFFYHYIEYEKKYFGILGAVVLGLGYLTKPYIIPLAISIPIYVLIRQKWHIFFKSETWLCIGILIILTVPYTFLSFTFANEDLGVKTFPPITFDLMLGYPKLLMHKMPLFTIIAAIGFCIGSYKRNRLVQMCLVWSICWYLFFTIVLGNYIAWRYTFSVLVAFAIPFSLPCYEAFSILKKVRLNKIFICILVCLFVYSAGSSPVLYLSGYKEAGRHVAQYPRGKSVLFYGCYDGSFMMGIRETTSQDGPYILRAERILADRRWFDNANYDLPPPRIANVQDLVNILDAYQTGYVVVERNIPASFRFPEFDILEDAVNNSNLFNKVKSFKIKQNSFEKDNELLIYSYSPNVKQNKAVEVTIPIPILGKEFQVSF